MRRLDYEVAELKWLNGQVAMHPLGPPRVPVKPIPSTSSASKFNAWEKPRASGTLESIVNQATLLPHLHHFQPNQKPRSFDGGGGSGGPDDMVPWFDHHRAAVAATASATASATMTMDALVPCSNRTDDQTTTQGGGLGGTCVVGCSNRAGSCSGPATQDQDEGRRAREARVPLQAAAPEWSSRDQSVSGSATCGGRDSQHVTTVDTCERDLGVGFTSTASLGSPDNTSSGKPFTKATTTEDHDSVCHSRPQASKQRKHAFANHYKLVLFFHFLRLKAIFSLLYLFGYFVLCVNGVLQIYEEGST